MDELTRRVDRLELLVEQQETANREIARDVARIAQDMAVTREAVRIFEDALGDVREAQQRIESGVDAVGRELHAHVGKEQSDRNRLLWGVIVAILVPIAVEIYNRMLA
ncbi:hypothetical protein [Thiorhodococcus fuscus]|uniref:Uncharacterized protein n=1 Tax=Thiorhodococcus fuscus TaxID=527200 RepID=A0ABW4YBQ2_9GAMM